MAVHHKFRKGDVVKLNSDDKHMTVVDYVADDTLPVVNLLLSKDEAASVNNAWKVRCAWMHEGRKEEGLFNEEMLELVNGDSVY